MNIPAMPVQKPNHAGHSIGQKTCTVTIATTPSTMASACLHIAILG